MPNMNGTLTLEKPLSFFPVDATTVKVLGFNQTSCFDPTMFRRSLLYFLGTLASSLGTKVGYLRSPAPQRSPNVSEIFRQDFIFVKYCVGGTQ